MWTCQTCEARNWDEDGVCHKCKAPIDLEHANTVQPRARPEPEPAPTPLPKQIKVIGGSFFTDGGSIFLKVRDETGAEYSVALKVSHGRRSGGWRLFFRGSRVALASQMHSEILRLFRNASIASSPEPADRPPVRETGRRNLTIVGDDLKELFRSMENEEQFLGTLRDNLVVKLESLHQSPSQRPFRRMDGDESFI